MSIICRASLIAALSVLLCSAQFSQAQTPSDPTMKLQGLDGKVYDLTEQRGNVVLVSFGATWCAPCTTELQALQELLTEYRDQPVKFYWVSIERPEEVTNSQLKQYAKQRRVTFPVLRDTAKMVFLQFSQRVRLPMIVMLGKDGKVDAPIHFGMRSQADAYKADIRTLLNRLLASPSPTGTGIKSEGGSVITTRRHLLFVSKPSPRTSPSARGRT